MTPQRDQLRHLFDKDRAGLQAGAAGGAGPDHLLADTAVAVTDQRLFRLLPLFEENPVFQQVQFQVMDQPAGIERLAGGACRAGKLAAATFCAGEAV